MIIYLKIKPAFIILAAMFFQIIAISLLAQEIVTVKEGDTKLTPKDIIYSRRLSIEITPVLNYQVDEDDKESIEIWFNAEWYDPKNNEPKSPDNKSIYIINNPNEFIELCENSRNIGYKRGIKNPETEEIRKTLELTPENIINYIPGEVFDPFVKSSRKVMTNITNYNNEVIKMNVLFYLGTKTSTENWISETSKLLIWEFRLPSTRPGCKAKFKRYNKRYEKLRPKKNIQSLYDDLQIAKQVQENDLDSLSKDIVHYRSAVLYQLPSLKDSIEKDISEFNCDNLNVILVKIDQYRKNADRIESMMEDIVELKAADKSKKKYDIDLKSFYHNVDSAQRIYRDLKQLLWEYKATSKFDSTLASEKITKFKKLNTIQDTLYIIIKESGNKDPKIDLYYKEFKGFYTSSMNIDNSFSPEKKKTVSTAGQDDQKISKPVKRGIPFFWYIIPILSFILGLVAFKYIGLLKKGKAMKNKTKS